MMFSLLLIGLFIGAMREMQKQEKKRSTSLTPAEADAVLQKLFRAQRNFFISMFTTLLLFILYRIGSLIMAEAEIENEGEEVQLQIKTAAELVTRASQETAARLSIQKEQIRLELHETNDEIRRLKEKLCDAEKHREMMQSDLQNSRTETEELSKRCSVMKLRLGKEEYTS